MSGYRVSLRVTDDVENVHTDCMDSFSLSRDSIVQDVVSSTRNRENVIFLIDPELLDVYIRILPDLSLVRYGSWVRQKATYPSVNMSSELFMYLFLQIGYSPRLLH